LYDHIPERIIARMDLQCYEKGEFLFRQDEEIHAVFFLLEGKLQVDGLHPSGKQVVFSMDEPFSIVGDLELFNAQRVAANVQAMQDSLVFAMPVDVIRDYYMNDPHFLHFFIRYLTQRLYLDVPLIMQASLPAETRLARYLLLDCHNQGMVIRLENRESISALLNISARHINRIFLRWSQAGIITKKNKQVQILDLQRLQMLIKNGT
jgi:CRP-like cAMP-binding protein